MNNIDDELSVKCRVASVLGDAEDQGYYLGPTLCKKLSMTSEQLLHYIVAVAGFAESDNYTKEINIGNVKRDIGVIRWCLDQRPKAH